ncbi:MULTISPECIES: hypothetical protein [unclassified Roseitalea]|uniref:hypothetical protein n=1 Tax=unclassified Roseitalea TaxID=2639107 RepID=UPI00273E76C0|nr:MULTISPECIES: hypothetical protein [unclassified Roseitalea]
MKRVSQFEAAKLSTGELNGLLTEAFWAFATARRGSKERQDALASIKNIERELAARPPRF